MNTKDQVFFALCLALSAMGFAVTNLLRGLWFDAAFALVVMLLAGGFVVRFIVRAQLPQAFRRHGWGS